MNNSSGIEKPYIQSYTPIVPEPTIKQEIVTPITNFVPMNSCQILPNTLNQSINLQSANESIEYMPNELDDGNIQGNKKANKQTKKNHKNNLYFNKFFFLWCIPVLNVYTTHIPEMSNTLPTIIMQDDSNLMNTTAGNSNFTLQKQLSLQPTTYSLISEDLIKQSYSDDGCSSDDQSDVDIDL